MAKPYRHRRSSNPANPFPNPLEPGELAVNTANRQIAIGDADAAAVGAPLSLIAVRFFDVRASYILNDMVVVGGKLYVANGAIPPGPFNVSQWTEFSGGGGGGGPTGDFLPLTGGTLTGVFGISFAVGDQTSLLDWGDGVHYGFNTWQDDTGYAELDITGWGEGGAYSGMSFAAARGSQGAPAASHINDEIGHHYIYGGHGGGGGGFKCGASWGGIVDGAPVADTGVPTALIFKTGQDAAGIERLRIGSNGTSVFKGDIITTLGGLGVISPTPYVTVLKPPGAAWANGFEGGIGVQTDWSDYQARWQVQLGDSNPEGPGNVGNNFQIVRFDNTGAPLGTPLSIDRATGQVIVSQAPTQPNSVATKSYAVARAGDTMSGDLTIDKTSPVLALNDVLGGNTADVRFNRNGKRRWLWRLGGDPESGGNAGSSMTLVRYDDDGVSGAANALQLDRATGEMYLRRDPTQALGAATKQYVDAGVRAINNVAAPTYTLVLSDTGKLLVVQLGSTITVPANATVAIPIGAQIDLAVAAPFVVTITPAASVAIYSEDNKRKLPKLGSCATLVKISTDVWMLSGSLIA